MRTTFFTVGTMLATLASIATAIDLEGNTEVPANVEAPLDADTEVEAIADADAEWRKNVKFNHNQLAWGDKCRATTDQECKQNPNCSVCRYSWPKNDWKKWNSQDAACRCKADHNTFKRSQLNWGDKCKHHTDQDCGKNPNCSICRWSWPKWDKDAWRSKDALCRCKSEVNDYKPNQLGWGDKCNKSTDQDCGKNPNCSICRWSWPKNDRDRWNSKDSRCRCKNEVGHYKPE